MRGNPDNAETNFALGNLWLARGDRDKAKWFYRRTLQLDPRHDRALNNLGVLAIEEKRWPLAEVFLCDSLRIEPNDAKTNYLLAQTRVALSNLDGASLRSTPPCASSPISPITRNCAPRSTSGATPARHKMLAQQKFGSIMPL